MYLASNVEDVALTLCRHAIGSGMQVVPEGAEPASEIEWMHASRPSGWQYTRVPERSHAHAAARRGSEPCPDRLPARLPRRQERWREAGGECADGGGWAAAVAMPWASETERAHMAGGRTVHRIVLRKPP